MKLLQRKREDTRLQQWSLPSEVSQGYCLLPGLPHWDLLFLLIWMLSSESLTECQSVLVMLSISGFLMMQKLTSKIFECSSYFRLGVHVGSSLLTLLCCVLAHMEHTRLEDVTEVHILE
jgi:hypothetical protein